MDATPLLATIARALGDAKLDAVLIGNAAAALQGAPVTTVDFDFLFRATPRNLAKLRTIARALDAAILRPYYPASDLYRLTRDDDGLQVDFMGRVHGIRSFEGVRDRASTVELDGESLLVASLDDIIRSKRAAKRPRDLAVLEILEKAREKRPDRRHRRDDALARESERALRDMIRRWQALPPERRTNFLRKRLGPGRSAL